MNMPYPIFPTPIPYNNRIEEEIIKLNQEIIQLKERITKLENKKQNDYLQKDDSLYMMWTLKMFFFYSYLWYTNIERMTK